MSLTCVSVFFWKFCLWGFKLTLKNRKLHNIFNMKFAACSPFYVIQELTYLSEVKKIKTKFKHNVRMYKIWLVFPLFLLFKYICTQQKNGWYYTISTPEFWTLKLALLMYYSQCIQCHLSCLVGLTEHSSLLDFVN